MQTANYQIYSSNDIKTQLAICRIWAHKVFIKASIFKTDSFSNHADPFFPPNIEAASTTPTTIPAEKRVIFHTNFLAICRVAPEVAVLRSSPVALVLDPPLPAADQVDRTPGAEAFREAV